MIGVVGAKYASSTAAHANELRDESGVGDACFCLRTHESDSGKRCGSELSEGSTKLTHKALIAHESTRITSTE
jgi:hypothetical protein